MQGYLLLQFQGDGSWFVSWLFISIGVRTLAERKRDFHHESQTLAERKRDFHHENQTLAERKRDFHHESQTLDERKRQEINASRTTHTLR
ncbi:hypothetical protein RRG08_024911 [Elysia crispata]|uniref:Uncharacterized protein n=1 Tax=Elysia crispata TaxID=231223 RepID=A0AAE1A054_9GAST|nr:hypothetical protein RRG08_024911 [Elysia crispata]